MRIGLVLAGGFAKGAYQVGALRALEKFVPKSDIYCISAASIGALNAYAYATDNLNGAEKLWNEAVEHGGRRFITGLMRGNLLQENINRLVNDAQPLSQPLYCPLLDWRTQTLAYQNLSDVKLGDLRKYLRASVALPPYNAPVTVADVSYYDGGLVDNIPVAPLVNTELDYVICFYFDEANYEFENAYFDNRIIKVSFASESMLSHSFVLTSEKIADMIRVGYEFTMERLTPFFEKGKDDLEHIYKTIEISNRRHTKPSRRLTVDVVISNLNRLTKKLTRRKDIK